MSAPGRPPPWYVDGLRFACARCGACCSGAPGHVWVSLDESHRIARLLGQELDEFLRRHVRRVGSHRLSLLERNDGDCEFLVREGSGAARCAIHPVRPVQCRTWPFWRSNLKSPGAWRQVGRDCPGIDTGSLHSLAVIEAALQANGDLPL